jgi:pyruvate,water dikinase
MMLRWLDELGDADDAAAGPKMARLGTLRRLGLDIPDGFAVTAEAFLHFLAASGLEGAIDRELATLGDPEDFAALETVSGRIRGLIEVAPLDPSLETALQEAYQELCFRHGEIALPVAVRSSAIGEDSANASFAGLYESYLGIVGEDAVAVAIRRTWASLYVARALSYRLRQRQHHRDTPMAVGVMRLVQARAAGVAFTAHPVTQKRDRVVIEGSWGWGEAVVQGLVQPDHIELDKSDGRVIEYKVADKRVVSTFDWQGGGVVERAMPNRFRAEPCLSHPMVEALWHAAQTIEAHYRQPVDLEWVIEHHWREGRPASIVQVRPITTLHDAPVAAPKWDPLGYAAKYGLGLPHARPATPEPGNR